MGSYQLTERKKGFPSFRLISKFPAEMGKMMIKAISGAFTLDHANWWVEWESPQPQCLDLLETLRKNLILAFFFFAEQ